MRLRRMETALVASVALNLFCLGAGLTVYALHGARAHGGGGQRSSMRAAALVLDAPHRSAFTRLLHDQGEGIQTETREARAIRDAAWASLGADRFDPVDVKHRLAQARELNVLAHSRLEDAVVDFTAGLPAEQRRPFSEALRRAAARSAPDPARRLPEPP